MRAAVLGSNGQDGSYLAEHLLAQGHDVLGIARQPASRYVPEGGRFQHHQLDLSDGEALSGTLSAWRPGRIYHLAAIHGASGFVYEDKWQSALKVNVGAVHACLEYIRLENREARLLYASSLKVFGRTPPETISEINPKISSCLYSITKNASKELIDYYRSEHGVQANVVYLFNHESPRRPGHFFLPRVVGILADILKGKAENNRLKTLHFACDWGSSREYMELGAELLERGPNEDHILATGKTWRGEEFVSELFAKAGLNWQEHIELELADDDRPIHLYHGDISRLEQSLGRRPGQSAIDVALWILRENHGLEV